VFSARSGYGATAVAVSCQHRGVQRRPQVVAHRGASEDAAEHTLAAYRRAIASGADALECDVRLTRDGVLVCVHDRRVDRTSDGHGVVSALELAELAELDFSSWHPSRVEVPDTDDADDGADLGDHSERRVLTLERLLETVADCGRRIEVAIETKHPTRYAGLVELTLVDLLSRFGLQRPDQTGRSSVRVMSFASSSLRRVRGLAPAVPTVYLMQRVPLRLRDGTLPGPADAVGPSLRALRAVPSYVERAHAHGAAVHAWTVDHPDDVDYVVGLGVDVIITNRPAAVLRQLALLTV
jgi:glycerophosphoryl diester phosphodiesterase